MPEETQPQASPALETPVAKPRVCGYAIASLACSLLPVPFAGGFFALLFGFEARTTIERSQGTLTGRGLTSAGLILGGLALMVSLVWFIIPLCLSSTKKGPRTEAVANAKSIGLALFNFQQDYGSFPCDETIAAMEMIRSDSGMKFGNRYSNDYFRQLIAAGYSDRENMFYAKAPYTRKPDLNLKGDKCLASGECGFAYVMATQSDPVPSSENSGRPIVVAAVNNGATDGTFELDAYDRRAIVLRIDGSATDVAVRPSDKKILVGGGKTLLEGGSEDTVWGTGIHPILKAPKMLRGN